MTKLEVLRELIDKMIQRHICKGSDLSIINELEKIDDEMFKIIKSLQGIENNNEWIKIESEYDLPKEYGLYWTVSDGKIGLDNFKDEFDKECWLEEYTDGNLTHYQPIVKPKPPIY